LSCKAPKRAQAKCFNECIKEKVRVTPIDEKLADRILPVMV